MSSKYTNNSLVERAWEWLARPAVVGGSFVALGLVEWLRASEPSSEGTLVVRFAAVFALICGLAFLLDSLRPSARQLAELSARGVVRAWWYPFFTRELQRPPARARLGLFASVLAYATLLLGVPSAILAASLQSHSSGELVLISGQGSESFLTEAPEQGLRRAMGVKLELLRVTVDGPTPEAVLRATDMRSLAATELNLKSAEGVRVREVVVALREIRPLGGLGAVDVRIGEGANAETLRVERGMGASLSDGREVRWLEASANRLGALGPAVQLGIYQDGALVSRRWLYIEAPELEAIRAQGEVSMSVVGVGQPSAVVLSVREMSNFPWGVLGIVLLTLLAIARLGQRLAPVAFIGRDGDWIALSARDEAHADLVDALAPHLREQDAHWVQPVREEEV